ncbi:hypothetical protein BSB_09710 [Bacillus stercoris]|nr:hypothetical protein BSB_09710 [Bacillus stercoris]
MSTINCITHLILIHHIHRVFSFLQFLIHTAALSDIYALNTKVISRFLELSLKNAAINSIYPQVAILND